MDVILHNGDLLGTGPIMANLTKNALTSVTSTHFTVKIVVKYKYAGTVEEEYNYRFSDASLGLTAAAVRLSQQQIIM